MRDQLAGRDEEFVFRIEHVKKGALGNFELLDVGIAGFLRENHRALQIDHRLAARAFSDHSRSYPAAAK